jgi:3-hydroxyisobutyrate dehydrogenase-like beta-hydroxyacid dehydrogenase
VPIVNAVSCAIIVQAELTTSQTSTATRRWTAASAGKGYIDVSTVDAGTAQKVASAIREAGGQYLEAPVSGSKQPAEKGQLIFLAGGTLSCAHGW